MSVILETSLGDLVIDLHVKDCPKAARNFLKLCKIKYYNNCLVHSVQKDFLFQSGDPTGTGRGGDSINGVLYGSQARFFPGEITARQHKRGVVAMAGSHKDANASQFFVVLAKHADSLDGKHTIFGEVAEGLDVLDKVNESLVDDDNRPLKNIRIKHTVILDDPFEDPKGLEVPAMSPVPVRDKFDIERLADDENLDDPNEGKTMEQINEEIRVSEAKSRAVVLEMLNDLPDADVIPPDNVIFVCKLNPVTRDEDLELIFCRFGGIKSCEIIRDWKTGDSLQYAFIEFETAQMCEQAHLKMENVLIDDRRIHVDFSQSVAKLWNSWRRGDRDLSNQPVPDSGKRLQLKPQYRPNADFSYVHRDSDKKKGGLMVKQEIKVKEEDSRPRGGGREKKDDRHGSNKVKEESRGRDEVRHDDRHKDSKRSRHS